MAREPEQARLQERIFRLPPERRQGALERLQARVGRAKSDRRKQMAAKLTASPSAG